MKLRDLRIGWRMLVQEPAYSAVVVLGLAVGFAACFLLLGFVRYSFSYDSEVPDAQQVQLVKTRFNIIGKPNWWDRAPLPLLEAARRDPMVADATMMFPLPVSMKAGAQVQPVQLVAVNPGFAAMFGIRAVEGDMQAALSQPDSVALTSSAARRIFGRSGVLGETVTIDGGRFRVAAVLPDPPPNSTIYYEALAGTGTSAWYAGWRNSVLASWGQIGGRVYIKLKPGASAAALEQTLQAAVDRSPLMSTLGPDALRDLGNKKALDVRLGALPAMYFDRDTANTPGSGEHGDVRVIAALGAIALMILLLAATNYVNLATVRTTRRQREIAVRKVLGASAGRLVGQFVAESMLVALIATGLGLLLAWLLLPLFSELVDRKLDGVFGAANLAAALALGASTGAAASFYPAWIALAVRPQHALAGRGSAETSAGLWLRRALTVGQFSSAIALTAVTLAIAWQTHYASNANPGFDADALLVVELPDFLRGPQAQALRVELARLPGAKGAAVAQEAIGRPTIGNHVQFAAPGGARSNLMIRDVSTDFFGVIGVGAMDGRLFDSSADVQDAASKVVLNPAAARALGYADAAQAVGQILSMGSSAAAVRVIGIAPPIRHQSLHEPSWPIVYRTSAAPLASREPLVLMLRGDGDMRALEAAAETVVRRHAPDQAVVVRRASGYLANNYAGDLRLAKLLALASLIAIAIASFGIYVLATYSVQRMARQIVLRKLYGAGRRAILALVGREFAGLLALGAVIALPLAAVVIARYLAGYVERAPIGAWPLLAALLLAALVTLLSTLRHTLGALRMAPAHLLRD